MLAVFQRRSVVFLQFTLSCLTCMYVSVRMYVYITGHSASGLFRTNANKQFFLSNHQDMILMTIGTLSLAYNNFDLTR